MATPRKVALQVCTFAEGALSRFGHDLVFELPAMLSLTASGVAESGFVVKAEVALSELRLLGALVDRGSRVECLKPGLLPQHVLTRVSQADQASILKTAHEGVLSSNQFAQASYEGRVVERASQLLVTGTLELHGKRQSLDFHATGELSLDEPAAGDDLADTAHLSALAPHGVSFAVELAPSRWGIKPYRAMLGALKLEDRIVVCGAF